MNDDFDFEGIFQDLYNETAEEMKTKDDKGSVGEAPQLPASQKAAPNNDEAEKDVQDQIMAFGYSRNQWTQKENDFLAQLAAMTLPPDVKPSDVQDMALKIDSLLTQVRIDDIRVQQKLQVYELQLKVLEKTLYRSIKNDLTKSGQKATVGEIEGMVAQKIDTTPWDGTAFSLYTLRNEYHKRSIFTTTVIKSLNEKKDLLITHSGILKIENSVGSLEGNVPNVPNGY